MTHPLDLGQENLILDQQWEVSGRRVRMRVFDDISPEQALLLQVDQAVGSVLAREPLDPAPLPPAWRRRLSGAPR